MTPIRLAAMLAFVLAAAASGQALAQEQESVPAEVPSILPPPGPSAPPLADFLAKTDADDVLAVYERLVDRGRDRIFFGLPEQATWRVEGPIRLALYGDQAEALTSALLSAAESFAQAIGMRIELAAARPLSAVAGAEGARLATGANLEIVFGPRPVIAQMSAAIPVNDWMLGRFEAGQWPFTFAFPREESLIGRVLVAEDEPPETQEAALVLALVWALGGVTLADGLEGLVEPAASTPTLTPLGAAVFALMYQPEMEAGQPIPEAIARARTLLGE